MAWSVGVTFAAFLFGSSVDERPVVDVHVERGAAAGDCPDAPALTALIEEIERRPNAGAPAAPITPGVRAAVTFERSPTGYRAALRLFGAREGERTLTDTGPSCAALGRAVAITLALSLESGTDPQAPVEKPIAPLPPTSPRGAPVSVGISGGVALVTVGAPSLAAGIDVAVEMGRRLSIEGSGRHVLARASTLEPGEVRVSLDAAILRLCAVAAGVGRALQANVCAAGAAGVLHGEGVGYPSAGTAASAWVALGGGLDARWRVGARWRLSLGVEALVPLRQDTFSIENRGVAFSSGAVSWTTRLGVACQVW
jgi:hypothetical protein